MSSDYNRKAKTTMSTICIYHHPCVDGFSAAWAVWKRFGNGIEYFPGHHGDPPPDVAGKDVIMVDFSYKRPVIDQMIEQCASLLILDHHKTAQADLADLPPASLTWDGHLKEAAEMRHGDPLDKVGVWFDMSQSGAMMAWKYFHPGQPVPQMIKHVQDRDLWLFKMPETKALSSTFFSYDYSFDTWSDLELACENPYVWKDLVIQGTALQRKMDKDIRELMEFAKIPMVLGGYTVNAMNLPYQFSSEAGGALAEGMPFGATFYDTAEHRHFSLRSRDSGVDVSEIAKKYGGGGHRNAAGFRMPRGWNGEPAVPSSVALGAALVGKRFK